VAAVFIISAGACMVGAIRTAAHTRQRCTWSTTKCWPRASTSRTGRSGHPLLRLISHLSGPETVRHDLFSVPVRTWIRNGSSGGPARFRSGRRRATPAAGFRPDGKAQAAQQLAASAARQTAGRAPVGTPCGNVACPIARFRAAAWPATRMPGRPPRRSAVRLAKGLPAAAGCLSSGSPWLYRR
jgi:hypothetical protein